MLPVNGRQKLKHYTEMGLNEYDDLVWSEINNSLLTGENK
jgi:hypothetical protein